MFQGQGNASTVLRFNDTGTKPEYIFTERWTEDNKDALHPRAFDGYDRYNRRSSYHMRNASFVRLKNLELSYDLTSAKWMSASFFKQCRIYVRGQNLWILDHLKYWDPETPFDANETTRGSRAKYYPQTITYSVGIDLTL